MAFEVYVLMGGIFYVIIFILGLSLGSFLNSWIWRHYENIRISRGRSICPGCRIRLKWYENIPLFSCLILGGKCRTCKTIIPKHFFWVELSTALLFLLVTWHHLNIDTYSSDYFHRNIFFAGILLVIFIYDYLYKIIVPGVVWIGVGAGIYFNYIGDYQSISSMLIAGVVAGGFFLAQYLFSKGKWIGGGDVRLGFMMGVWLGWPQILVALMLAYVSGAIIGIALMLIKKKNMQSEIPFGTFLAVATFITIYLGDNIIQWYLSLIR